MVELQLADGHAESACRKFVAIFRPEQPLPRSKPSCLSAFDLSTSLPATTSLNLTSVCKLLSQYKLSFFSPCLPAILQPRASIKKPTPQQGFRAGHGSLHS